VCAPNIKSFPEEFLTSFTAFYDLVFNFCETFKEPVAFLPFPCPSTHFQNKGFNRLNEILNSFAPQPPFIWKIIHDFDSFPQNFKNPSHIPTCSQILQTRNALGRNLVLGIPDKNSGIPDLYCPQSFGKICTLPSIQIQTSKGNITCLSKLFFNILNTLMRQMGGLFLDLFVNMVPSPTHTKLESLKICQDLGALFPTFTTL